MVPPLSGEIQWQARSLDLVPSDYFQWGYLKAQSLNIDRWQLTNWKNLFAMKSKQDQKLWLDKRCRTLDGGFKNVWLKRASIWQIWFLKQNYIYIYIYIYQVESKNFFLILIDVFLATYFSMLYHEFDSISYRIVAELFTFYFHIQLMNRNYLFFISHLWECVVKNSCESNFTLSVEKWIKCKDSSKEIYDDEDTKLVQMFQERWHQLWRQIKVRETFCCGRWGFAWNGWTTAKQHKNSYTVIRTRFLTRQYLHKFAILIRRWNP